MKTQFPSPTTPGVSNPADFETFTYDANGNVTAKKTRKGPVIASAYDALNRVTLKTPGADKPVAYKYDLMGKQADVRFTDGSYILTSAFDSAGRLASINDRGRLLTYLYDPASNRTRVTWPDAFYAHYEYDTLNRVTAVNENTTDPMVNELATYNYDALSRRTSLSLGNGLVTSYTYEADGALNTLAHDLSGTANDVTYGFDYTLANQLGLKTLTNALYIYAPPVNDSKAYVVNGLNQYASVTTTGQGQTTANLAYDANGSITGDGTWVYAYDAENRLISAIGQGSTVTFEYDPLGRRSAKVVNGVRTEYLSDGVEAEAGP